jgi:glyoxylase-like metal-dependent hydrolase (beta-lactamase superfamily II)
MIQIYSFVFGPLEENTYILYDETGECLIVDPGFYDEKEKQDLLAFIQAKKLHPVRLINTHTHLDHILGNHTLSRVFKLSPEYHAFEDPVIRNAPVFAENFGLKYDLSPLADTFLKEGEKLKFGSSQLDILFTPGHSPGSLSFYSEQDKLLLAGDVLFKGSIGRTDIPFGDHEQLLESIQREFLVLPEDTRVYSGHGLSTEIGIEMRTNPYLI